jgi:hypothetical protein
MRRDGPRVKAGEGSKADRKKRFRIGLVVLVAISLFVCPLAAGGFGPPYGAFAQGERRFPFTPSIAPLEMTVTPGPWLLGETWEVGMAFDCRPGRPANCAPDLETRTGDDYFGYGEISGWPGLYLIWVTDEEATHCYVTVSTEGQFSSDTVPDDFSDLTTLRDEQVSALESARDTADIIGGVTGLAVPFLLILCPVTVVTCFGVAAGATIGAVIGAGTSYNAADRAEERISVIQGNLRARFGLIVPGSQAP